MKVGIDSLAVYIPKTYLSLEGEWAEARAPIFTDGDLDKLIGKIKKGVGVTKVAIPDMHEDVATMAAMAARKLLEQNQIDLSQIGYLAVSSETGLDQSKALSAYVLGMLEDYFECQAPHVGCVEYKFACVGSAYALESACALVRSGMLGDKKAIVIASDVAKYDLESVGEYTQGAGAVAMMISEDPNLIVLDSKPWASFTRNERDFFRPNWRTTPIVDGKYSMEVYCNCVDGAFRAYMGPEQTYLDFVSSIDKMLFHLPFPKMAEYAASRLLLSLEKPNLKKSEIKEAQKEFKNTEVFKSIFNEKIEKSLRFSGEVGNIYTGALFLGLASLVEWSLEDGEDLADQSVLFNAYGSGASSKVFGGYFGKNWKLGTKALDFKRSRKESVEISLTDYERLHQKEECSGVGNPVRLGGSVISPKDEFIFDHYGDTCDKTKIDLGYRYYNYER